MWCYKVLFDEWLSMKIGLLPQNNDTIVKNIIIIKPQDQATMIDNPRPTSELCMTPGSANKSTLQKSNPHIIQYKKSHAKQIFTEVRIIFTDR